MGKYDAIDADKLCSEASAAMKKVQGIKLLDDYNTILGDGYFYVGCRQNFRNALTQTEKGNILGSRGYLLANLNTAYLAGQLIKDYKKASSDLERAQQNRYNKLRQLEYMEFENESERESVRQDILNEYDPLISSLKETMSKKDEQLKQLLSLNMVSGATSTR